MSLTIKAKTINAIPIMIKTRNGSIALTNSNNPTAQVSKDNSTLTMGVRFDVVDGGSQAEYTVDNPPNTSVEGIYIEPNSVYDVYIGDLDSPVLANVKGSDIPLNTVIKGILFTDPDNQPAGSI